MELRSILTVKLDVRFEMNRLRKTVLAAYIMVIVVGSFPFVGWHFSDHLSRDPMWLNELRAVLTVPSLPLMFTVGMMDSSNIVVAILAPLYLAALFWPMAAYAFAPHRFQSARFRNVTIGYVGVLCAGCGIALLLTLSMWDALMSPR